MTNFNFNAIPDPSATIDNEKQKVIEWHKDRLEDLTLEIEKLKEEKQQIEKLLSVKVEEASMIERTLGYLEN